jgi:hypothetical protein
MMRVANAEGSALRTRVRVATVGAKRVHWDARDTAPGETGRAGLDQQPVLGYQPRGLAQRVGIFERDDAGLK